ncbi:hypothetical protein [Kocuria arenosa]|uniref:hypothetical protein n=1 Tax=Kocuria arenosa TaxID=3071446 RepID=UPI0034D6741A
MDSQFYVLLPLEPETTDVRLVVTGYLTPDNQQSLYPLIRKARATRGCGTVTVDLTGVLTGSTALDLLRWDLGLDLDEGLGELAPVRVLDPRADPRPV